MTKNLPQGEFDLFHVFMEETPDASRRRRTEDRGYNDIASKRMHAETNTHNEANCFYKVLTRATDRPKAGVDKQAQHGNPNAKRKVNNGKKI